MAKSSKQSNESLKQQKMTTTTLTTAAAASAAAAATTVQKHEQKQSITRATQILLFITVIHFNFLGIISMIMTVSTRGNAECVFVQFNRMPILKVRVNTHFADIVSARVAGQTRLNLTHQTPFKKKIRTRSLLNRRISISGPLKKAAFNVPRLRLSHMPYVI